MLLTLDIDLVMKFQVVFARICGSRVENNIYPFKSWTREKLVLQNQDICTLDQMRYQEYLGIQVIWSIEESKLFTN